MGWRIRTSSAASARPLPRAPGREMPVSRGVETSDAASLNSCLAVTATVTVTRGNEWDSSLP
jgi:hypothetical protein